MQKAATCLLPSDLLLFKCVAYAYMGVCACACACACALSRWTNQAKVWIWSLDYGSSASWFTCRWCHPLAVHSVLRQREPPCSQSLEKLEAQKAFQYFNATRCEEQKTQTDACSLRLSYNCHFFFSYKRLYSAFQLWVGSSERHWLLLFASKPRPWRDEKLTTAVGVGIKNNYDFF